MFSFIRLTPEVHVEGEVLQVTSQVNTSQKFIHSPLVHKCPTLGEVIFDGNIKRLRYINRPSLAFRATMKCEDF